MQKMKIGHIHVKTDLKFKDDFRKACSSKGLTESFVLRKLMEKWMTGETKIKFEV